MSLSGFHATPLKKVVPSQDFKDRRGGTIVQTTSPAQGRRGRLLDMMFYRWE